MHSLHKEESPKKRRAQSSLSHFFVYVLHKVDEARGGNFGLRGWRQKSWISTSPAAGFEYSSPLGSIPSRLTVLPCSAVRALNNVSCNTGRREREWEGVVAARSIAHGS